MFLGQRIKIEEISNYTLVIKCSNIVGNVIVEIYYMDANYENHKLTNGINIINITNKNIRDISPTIHGQGSIEIEYIDLFEGDIAYPHVKEDYATALNRCLFEGLEIFNHYVGECHNFGNKVQIMFKILPKKSTPTIKFNGNLCFLAKTTSGGIVYNNHSLNDVSIEVKKDTVIITSNKITQDLDSYLYGYFESSYGSYLEVTCESL